MNESLNTISAYQMILLIGGVIAAFRGLEWLVRLIFAKIGAENKDKEKSSASSSGLTEEEIMRLVNSDRLKLCQFEHKNIASQLTQASKAAELRATEEDRHFSSLMERTRKLQSNQESMLEVQEGMSALTQRLQVTVSQLGQTISQLSEQQASQGTQQADICRTLKRIEEEFRILRESRGTGDGR